MRVRRLQRRYYADDKGIRRYTQSWNRRRHTGSENAFPIGASKPDRGSDAEGNPRSSIGGRGLRIRVRRFTLLSISKEITAETGSVDRGEFTPGSGYKIPAGSREFLRRGGFFAEQSNTPCWSLRMMHSDFSGFSARSAMGDVNGPIHFVDFGGNGPPVLMVHGINGSTANWVALGPLLTNDAKPVALDLPGFGLSPLASRCGDPESFAETIAGFIMGTLCRPAIIVAASFGAVGAILLAKKHPELVLGLVLVSPILFSPFQFLLKSNSRMISLFFLVPGVRSTLCWILDRVVSPEFLVKKSLSHACVSPALVPQAIVDLHISVCSFRSDNRCLSFPTAQSLSRHLAYLRRNHRRLSRPATLSCPVLVIWGRKDEVVPIAKAEILQKQNPEWRFRVIDSTAHAPHIEQPDIVANHLIAWMKESTPFQ